ncbi:MAG: GntR family transcriptional regulator [Acetobacteraceae bacterium]|nr:GntR family transcriptional regulator [Acetobacteraceae bacterium]
MPDTAEPKPPLPRRFEPMRPRTMTESAMEAILNAAARGMFLPGDRLVEAEIARDLGISRVPVREALRLLESQGIVVNHPYRGMRLMQVTNRGVADIVEVRARLESLAAERAAAAIAARARPDALRAAHARFVAANAAGDPAVSAAADRAFHAAIIELGGNAVLLDLWGSLAARFSVLWGIAHRHKSRPTSAAEHEAILSAIEAGDAAAASEALRRHLAWYHEFDFEAAIAANRRAAR